MDSWSICPCLCPQHAHPATALSCSHPATKLVPRFGMTVDWDYHGLVGGERTSEPRSQPWAGCPQQGSAQSLWEKPPRTIWIRPYPGPEQFVPILCCIWEMLLLSCLFSLSPLLFFHPESFKREAL